MADNITAPGAGTVLATDEFGGVHYPRVKVTYGGPNAAIDVSSTTPLPVAMSIPTGAATEAKQDALVAKLPSLGPKASSGSVSVAPANDAAFPVINVVSDPAERWVTVTPSDTVDLPAIPKALFVGGGGTIVLHGSDNLAATFTWVEQGTVLPLRAKRVKATGTTATNIVALY